MPVLVIQMGHVGRPPNPGSVGTAGEQAFSRAVGRACERVLHGRGGWQVRTVIADPPATSYRGDAFVAIHADGSDNAKVRGGSVGYQTDEGARLAHAWQAAYTAAGFTGGWQRDNYTDNLHFYYGVREAVRHGNRRAFIAECGHLTNSADRALMTGPGGPERVARAIGTALGIPVDTKEDDVSLNSETIDVPVGTPGYEQGGKLFASVALGEALHEVKVTQKRAQRLEDALATLSSAVTAQRTELDRVVGRLDTLVKQIDKAFTRGAPPRS